MANGNIRGWPGPVANGPGHSRMGHVRERPGTYSIRSRLVYFESWIYASKALRTSLGNGLIEAVEESILISG